VLVMIAMCVALYKDLRQDPLVRRGQRAEVAIEQAVDFGTQAYGDGFYVSVKPNKGSMTSQDPAYANDQRPEIDMNEMVPINDSPKSSAPARAPAAGQS